MSEARLRVGLIGALRVRTSGTTSIPNSQAPPLVIIPLVTVPNDEGVGITHNVGPGTITLDADTWFDIDFGVRIVGFSSTDEDDLFAHLWNDTKNNQTASGSRFDPSRAGIGSSTGSIKYKTGPVPETISLRAFQISGGALNADNGYIHVVNLGQVIS